MLRLSIRTPLLLGMAVAGLAAVAPAVSAETSSLLQPTLAAAATQGKPALVEFYASWCGSCKQFARAVTSDPEIQKVLDSFVLTQLIGDSADVRDLMKEMSVIGYPTFLVMNADGTTLSRWIGYSKAMFLRETAAVLADPTTIEEKEARFAATPTAEDAAKLAVYRDSRGEYDKAVEFYRRAQRLAPDTASRYALPIFESTFYGFRKSVFPRDSLVAAARGVFADEKAPASDLLEVANMMSYVAASAGEPELARPFLKIAVERTEGDADSTVQAARKEILPDYALLVLRDPEKAVQYKKESMPPGWMEDAGALNEFAWWCFENNVNLAEADTLAYKGVQLAAPGREKAMILDTLAEIRNAEGDPTAALELTRKAIQEDPRSEHYKKQLERFQKLVEEPPRGSR